MISMKKPYCDAGHKKDCFHMEFSKSDEQWVCSLACGLTIDLIEEGECPLDL